LWLEAHEKNVTQILIVNLSKLDKMTVSKALKKLVAMQLVNRIEHAIDTRAKKISLTTKGRVLVRKLVPMVEKIDAEFFGKVSVADQQQLVRVFGGLAK
jgi:DNA-binding MarR family transcriptional regulator